MPTFPSDRESKTHTTLPDIFRTIRGDNLGIGPQSRIRDAGTKENKVQWGRGIEPQIAPASYPRIVLRDALGYELDTYTTLQEAIYRAKWNVKQSGQAKTPIEWRLPKAPPPARPDLTRTCPPVKHPATETEADRQRKKQPYTNILEFDVDDVGFVKESLQCLPYVPSLSFLRQEFLCGPKMYFQIVGTMLLHERFLSLTEKRNAVYNFPGFCAGCTRMGLCYGCEKSSEPHYHEDKPVKTGGGFTYFKKDRPEREIKGKNPAHWRINHPDHALKQLMEEYAGVDLEGAVPEEVKKHLDQYGGHREHKISHIPDFATEMNQFNRTNGDMESFLPEIVNPADLDGHHGNTNFDGHHDNNNLIDLASGNLRSRSYGNIQDEESDIEKYEMMRDQGQGDGSQGQQIESDYSYQDSQGRHGNKRRSRSEEARKDVINIAVGKRGSSNDRGDCLPNIKKEDSDQIDEDSSEEDREEGKSRGRSSKRKGNLYKPPPAFKLKKSPSRRIESKSPFSSERKYNIPLGSGFQVKKSDKAPTKFKDFRNVDVSWKEPKKFELKDSSAKTTKFWSGPRKNKDDSNNRKHRRRSPGAGRGRSRHNQQQQLGSTTPRSITPDSGLDSELMTDVKAKKKPSGRSSRQSRKITPHQVSTNSDDGISHLPTNQMALDEFSDTATEYYKNAAEVDVNRAEEQYHRQQRLLKNREQRLAGLSPLNDSKEFRQYRRKKEASSQTMAVYQPRSEAISPIIYEGYNSRRNNSDNSDSDENWEEGARKAKHVENSAQGNRITQTKPQRNRKKNYSKTLHKGQTTSNEQPPVPFNTPRENKYIYKPTYASDLNRVKAILSRESSQVESPLKDKIGIHKEKEKQSDMKRTQQPETPKDTRIHDKKKNDNKMVSSVRNYQADEIEHADEMLSSDESSETNNGTESEYCDDNMEGNGTQNQKDRKARQKNKLENKIRNKTSKRGFDEKYQNQGKRRNYRNDDRNILSSSSDNTDAAKDSRDLQDVDDAKLVGQRRRVGNKKYQSRQRNKPIRYSSDEDSRDRDGARTLKRDREHERKTRKDQSYSRFPALNLSNQVRNELSHQTKSLTDGEYETKTHNDEPSVKSARDHREKYKNTNGKLLKPEYNQGDINRYTKLPNINKTIGNYIRFHSDESESDISIFDSETENPYDNPHQIEGTDEEISIKVNIELNNDNLGRQDKPDSKLKRKRKQKQNGSIDYNHSGDLKNSKHNQTRKGEHSLEKVGVMGQKTQILPNINRERIEQNHDRTRKENLESDLKQNEGYNRCRESIDQSVENYNEAFKRYPQFNEEEWVNYFKKRSSQTENDRDKSEDQRSRENEIDIRYMKGGNKEKYDKDVYERSFPDSESNAEIFSNSISPMHTAPMSKLELLENYNRSNKRRKGRPHKKRERTYQREYDSSDYETDKNTHVTINAGNELDVNKTRATDLEKKWMKKHGKRLGSEERKNKNVYRSELFNDQNTNSSLHTNKQGKKMFNIDSETLLLSSHNKDIEEVDDNLKGDTQQSGSNSQKDKRRFKNNQIEFKQLECDSSDTNTDSPYKYKMRKEISFLDSEIQSQISSDKDIDSVDDTLSKKTYKRGDRRKRKKKRNNQNQTMNVTNHCIDHDIDQKSNILDKEGNGFNENYQTGNAHKTIIQNKRITQIKRQSKRLDRKKKTNDDYVDKFNSDTDQKQTNVRINFTKLHMKDKVNKLVNNGSLLSDDSYENNSEDSDNIEKQRLGDTGRFDKMKVEKTLNHKIDTEKKDTKPDDKNETSDSENYVIWSKEKGIRLMKAIDSVDNETDNHGDIIQQKRALSGQTSKGSIGISTKKNQRDEDCPKERQLVNRRDHFNDIERIETKLNHQTSDVDDDYENSHSKESKSDNHNDFPHDDVIKYRLDKSKAYQRENRSKNRNKQRNGHHYHGNNIESEENKLGSDILKVAKRGFEKRLGNNKSENHSDVSSCYDFTDIKNNDNKTERMMDDKISYTNSFFSGTDSEDLDDARLRDGKTEYGYRVAENGDWATRFRDDKTQYGDRETQYAHGERETRYGGRKKPYGGRDTHYGDRVIHYGNGETQFRDRETQNKETGYGDMKTRKGKREPRYGVRERRFGDGETQYVEDEIQYGDRETGYGDRSLICDENNEIGDSDSHNNENQPKQRRQQTVRHRQLRNRRLQAYHQRLRENDTDNSNDEDLRVKDEHFIDDYLAYIDSQEREQTQTSLYEFTGDADNFPFDSETDERYQILTSENDLHGSEYNTSDVENYHHKISYEGNLHNSKDGMRKDGRSHTFNTKIPSKELRKLNKRNQMLVIHNKNERQQTSTQNTDLLDKNEDAVLHFTVPSGEKLCTSPPNIPSDKDFDKGSLTSFEPDLELIFDDVIDVDNIEVVDSEEEENLEKIKAEEKRRRRHRHKRRKRREAEKAKDAANKYEEPENYSEKDKDASEIGAHLQNQSDRNTFTIQNPYDSELDRHMIEQVSIENRPLISRHKDEDKRINIDTEEEEIDSEFEEELERMMDESRDCETRYTNRSSRHKRRNKSKDKTSQDRKSKERSKDKNSDRSKHRSTSDKRSRDQNRGHSRNKRSKERDNKSRNNVHATGKGAKERKMKEGDSRNLKDGFEHEVDNFSPSDSEGCEEPNNQISLNKDGLNNNARDRAGEENGIDIENQDQHDENENAGTENQINDGDKRTKNKKKRKARRKGEGDVDLDKLPTIQTQVSKIMKGIPTDKSEKRNSKTTDQLVNELFEKIDPETGTYTNAEVKNMDSEEKWELVRPKSAQLVQIPDGFDNATLGYKGLRARSLSMPLLTDIEEMMSQMDPEILAKLKEPMTVPIYLPGFKGHKPKKQFKSNPQRVKGRDRSLSVSTITTPFLELGSGDSTIKSELEPLKEEPIIPTPSPSPPPPPKQEPELKPVTQEMADAARSPWSLQPQTPLPDQPPKTPPKRKEIVKKEKKEKPRPPKPPTPVHEPTPSPSPTPEEPPVTSREISFVFEKEPSGIELPPIEIPALPDMPTPQVAPKQKVKKELKLIEVTPQLPEPKKKLPPPPKVGPKIRPYTLRKSKVAEAPVTPQELQQLSDPLDFLAKYCIINPDRLPFYERIFNGAVSVQSPRYIRNDVPAPGQMVQLPPAVLSEHELNMLRDLTVLNHAQTPRREGMSAPEQYLEKLNYTVELIKSKQSTIQDHMAKLQGEKIHILAQLAKEMDRDISRVDYKVKGKAKKKESSKKKKKKKVDVVDYDKMGAMSMNAKDFKPTKASDITSEVIVSRMNDKMMKKAKKDPIVKTLSLEISRDIEKMKHYDQRIAQIEDEKDLVGLYCMDYYFSEQGATSRPHEFRRQQSRLYQKLHPDPDVEMNIEEVEMSLQQINNKLLTEKEFQYIYFILDLPKREKINFRLFSIIAALSEKVTQMDPMVRKLINKNDYNALDVKMEKSKELFDLLQDADLMPLGNAPSDNLAVELTAGGLTPEHTNYVLSKFDREGRGHCDFMDFVTYVPLFLQIHNRIISDPFNDSLDV